jgi:hypothetical protein
LTVFRDRLQRWVLPHTYLQRATTKLFTPALGMKSGPSYHQRYFQLKGWDAQKKKEMIHKRKGAYTAFGTVAMALNLIPVVSVFFTCKPRSSSTKRRPADVASRTQ